MTISCDAKSVIFINFEFRRLKYKGQQTKIKVAIVPMTAQLYNGADMTVMIMIVAISVMKTIKKVLVMMMLIMMILISYWTLSTLSCMLHFKEFKYADISLLLSHP